MPKLIHFCRWNIENGVERYVPEKPYYVRGATLDGRFMTKHGSMLVLADDSGFVTHYGKDLPKAIEFFIEKKIGWSFERYRRAAKGEAVIAAEVSTTTLASGAIAEDRKAGAEADKPPTELQNIAIHVSASGASLNFTDGIVSDGVAARVSLNPAPAAESALPNSPKSEELKVEEKPTEPVEETPKKKGKKK